MDRKLIQHSGSIELPRSGGFINSPEANFDDVTICRFCCPALANTVGLTAVAAEGCTEDGIGAEEEDVTETGAEDDGEAAADDDDDDDDDDSICLGGDSWADACDAVSISDGSAPCVCG